ncbi:MAG TPA: DNA phosphorothioation-associated putative methyltransferase, partial [Vicinamibacterales bacterium]|nr:DNA phosphorothioation-associated putative methyltransferase [Vicinamibacterales bacterium]
MRLAVDDGLILAGQTSVLDYGCGRGDDVTRLSRAGVQCAGWDPHHRTDGPLEPSDVVNLGYVINVIEDPHERQATLRGAWSLARSVLIVSARLTSDSRDLEGVPFRDGLRTSTGTFQKLYTQDELRTWIDLTLGVQSAAAAPGVFLIFRRPALEQAWLLRRVRRSRRLAPISRELVAQHEALLRPLVEFVSERGRLPRALELPTGADIESEFGTLRNAFSVIRRVSGTEPWDRVRDARSQDLLVFLALSRFDKRPRPKDLPEVVRYDIRDLFGSHVAACRQADQLLFGLANRERVRAAAAAAPIGKRLPTALYLHADAVGQLPSILRVLDGAARRLIGDIEVSTVVKLHLDRPAVSYLEYPEFDTTPHPALRSGYLVALDRLRCDFRDYSSHANPPILHRKELLLDHKDPRRARFAALTRQEERAGLYERPEAIGTRQLWQRLLNERGLR